jgi:tricorn protease
LLTVPITGGQETQLEIPNAFHATYSPDGKWMAYTPIADAFRQWKNYRGGSSATIWLFSFADKSIVKIPQPAGGCNDTGPMWMGNTVYFRSDRNGEFNLYSYDIDTKAVKQLTSFTDFPVLNASGGNGKVIFEQAGYLHLLDPSVSGSKKLTIGIAADCLNYVRGLPPAANISAAPIYHHPVRARWLISGVILLLFPRKRAIIIT